jgi:hydrogenase maturation protein HypF
VAIGETVIDPAPLLQAVIADWRAAVPLSTVAARFHNGLARMVADVCQRIRIQTGLHEVVLSGGVWQNVTLLRQTLHLLEAAGFAVYWHQQVPTNDGGLALGQAAVAAYSE